MKNTKHTPGPWSFSCNDKITQLIKSGRNEVARISHSTFGTDQDAANAALIAAAPEMFDALREAVSLLASRQAVNGASLNDKHILDLCLAAIAKARGEK